MIRCGEEVSGGLKAKFEIKLVASLGLRLKECGLYGCVANKKTVIDLG
jgi:hypothetical protein